MWQLSVELDKDKLSLLVYLVLNLFFIRLFCIWSLSVEFLFTFITITLSY